MRGALNPLTKFLLAVLLLAVPAISWAACPEGQKQTYKGCEAIEEKVTEEQLEATQATPEILELAGFNSEMIQIGSFDNSGTEMSVKPVGIGSGDDLFGNTKVFWLWRSFDVIMSGDSFPMVGKIGLDVSWWKGTEIYPDRIAVSFEPRTLPSIDIDLMLSCRISWGEPLVKEDGRIVLVVKQFNDRIKESQCIYQKLSEEDRAIVTLFVNELEAIVKNGTAGASDTDYWSKIALFIKKNFIVVSYESTGVYEGLATFDPAEM